MVMHKFECMPFEFEIGDYVETIPAGGRHAHFKFSGKVVARFYKNHDNSRWYVVEGPNGRVRLYTYRLQKVRQ